MIGCQPGFIENTTTFHLLQRSLKATFRFLCRITWQSNLHSVGRLLQAMPCWTLAAGLYEPPPAEVQSLTWSFFTARGSELSSSVMKRRKSKCLRYSTGEILSKGKTSKQAKRALHNLSSAAHRPANRIHGPIPPLCRILGGQWRLNGSRNLGRDRSCRLL